MKKGLPAKYAKMGFKKGWALFKKAGHIGFDGSKKHHKKSHKRHYILGGDSTAPAIIRAPIKKISSITPSRVISPIIDLGLIIIGMAVGATIKKVSPIKNPHLMNSAQTVVGVGGSLMTKNRFVKMPLLGVALQGTISEAKLLFPKLIPLAGDDEVTYVQLPTNGEDIPALEMSGGDDRLGSVEEIYGDSRLGMVQELGDDTIDGEISDIDGEGQGEPGEI